MTPLVDIEKDREATVKSICKSSDREHIRVLEDKLGKLDILAMLWQSWVDEKLPDLRLLTNKRLELDIQHATEMEEKRRLDGDSDYARFWQRKLIQLRLLQKLIQAWDGDMLGLIHFAVNIQE